MATFRDPETGVELNCVPLQRSSIRAGAETETAHRLLARGFPKHRIAAMLGVHPFEVMRVLGNNPRPPALSGLHDGHGDPDQQDLPL